MVNGETQVGSKEEKGRREAEAHGRRLYDDAPVPYLVLDDEERIRSINVAGENLFGASAEELYGKPWIELTAHTRAGKGHATELSQRMAAGETSVRADVEFRAADGQVIWGDVSARVRRNVENEVTEILVNVHDVTRFKIDRENLLETEMNFHVMADHAPVCLWMTDAQGNCSFVNQTWLKFTGRTIEMERGRGWVANVHPDDAARARESYNKAATAGTHFISECRLRRYDGVYRWLLHSGTPRFSSKGEFIGYLGASVDVTESKEVRETLIHANDELQRAVRTRDDFMSIASHELRTPLTVLVLQLAGMRRLIAGGAGAGDTRLGTKLEKAEWQTSRLENLIDNLLDMSRISVGKLTLRRESFDLSSAVRDVVNRSSEQARRNGTKIELHAQPGAFGEWDRLRIEQVVLNLLSNALKYGAGKPVEVSVMHHAQDVSIVVADHGVGIAKEDVGRIFKRFERAVSARNYGGLGLGLYIVDQIVEAHGGSVTVESTLGEGAAFTVVLPRASVPAQNTSDAGTSDRQRGDD